MTMGGRVVRAADCLVFANKSRPHLSTIQESQEGAVLDCGCWQGLPNTKLSLEQSEANGLQFSLTMEVLPLNNLKISSICQGCKYRYCFQLLEATMYGGSKWIQTSRKSLSYRWSGTWINYSILVTHYLHKSRHCYCPRLASNVCHFDLQLIMLILNNSRINKP